MSRGGVSLIVIVLLGLRKRPNGPAVVPLASTCSVAVSAAHHLAEDDRESRQVPLRYGTTSLHDGDGHCCCIMARDVRPSTSRIRYSWSTVHSISIPLLAHPPSPELLDLDNTRADCKAVSCETQEWVQNRSELNKGSVILSEDKDTSTWPMMKRIVLRTKTTAWEWNKNTRAQERDSVKASRQLFEEICITLWGLFRCRVDQQANRATVAGRFCSFLLRCHRNLIGPSALRSA